MAEYRAVLTIRPYELDANNNLANLLAHEGRLDEAERYYRQALKARPDSADVHNNLANLLARQGRLDEAVEHYRQAARDPAQLRRGPQQPGQPAGSLGRLDDAERHYRQAIEIMPNCVEALAGLGNAGPPRPARRGRGTISPGIEASAQRRRARNSLRKVTTEQATLAETLEEYRQALDCKPDDAATANNLARLLATCPSASLRNGTEAIEIARRVNRLAGDNQPAALDTLAAAYAEAGRFPEAIATARRALELAVRQNKPSLADGLRGRIVLYEKGKAFRQTARLLHRRRQNRDGIPNKKTPPLAAKRNGGAGTEKRPIP